MSRWYVFVFLTLTTASTARSAPPDFRKDIAPLLTQHCLKCHSGTDPKGDLDLTHPEGWKHVITPGKPDDSALIEQVREGRMPPKQPLSRENVEVLRAWVMNGAKWDGQRLQATAEATPRAGRDWWSLQPIRRPNPPANAEALAPIDAFIAASLRQNGLTFSEPADRRTLITRVTIDLIGLRPTAAEIRAFEMDTAPDAYERLVDRLLASPQYGERWARHWLDVVRFAESHGYEMNTLRPNAWPYRDYIIRALNQDIPLDRFIREQLAADTLRDADALTRAATGFLVAGPHDMVGNQTEEGKRQQRADDLADIVSNTSQTFLGLTVGCAKCHDHKFDPISQRDFYSVQGIFTGIEHADRRWESTPEPERRAEQERLRTAIAAVDRQIDEAPTQPRIGVRSTRNVERFPTVRAKSVRMTILTTTDGTQPCIDEIEVWSSTGDNVALASAGAKPSASSAYPGNPFHQIVHLNDGQYGNSRSWISNEAGKGWCQIEFAQPVNIERIVWARDREGQFRDRLAREYRWEYSLDGEKWLPLTSSQDRAEPGQGGDPALLARRAALSTQLDSLTQERMVYAGRFREPDVSYLLKRGDVMQRGEPIAPGGLPIISPELRLPMNAPEAQRRVAFADWLSDPRNPLTARVMVNRLWHWHFGQGIVRTPSDFGAMGDRPSHPELLDWLASEFMANGGRWKPIHRAIVLSRTYRQASALRADAAGKDASNRWLWRYPPRRVEAEVLRDTMLQVSGSLQLNGGGPGYHLWDYSGYVIVFTPKTTLGPDTFRRMIYQFKPRLQQDGTFGAFDCPDATAAAPRRTSSTTALQALNLLHSEFAQDQAARFAARIERESSAEPSARVQHAFELAFGRTPTDRERSAAVALVREHGLEPLCRALLNSNEFAFID